MSTPKKIHWRFILATLAGLVLYPGHSGATEVCLPPPTTDAECLKCHQALVDRDLAKTYVHQPFREGKCMLCHLGGELTTPETTSFKAEAQMIWLAESPFTSSEHWFPLPKNQLHGDILLDIMLPDRTVYRGVITSSDLTALPELPLDQTPPKLTEVKIDGIEKGLFWSATISWLTDELADTRIAYGTDRLDTNGFIAEMKRSHQITIAPLRAATEYQFQVSSADYLGNLAQATTATFSTSSSLPPALQPLTPRSLVAPSWDRRLYQDSLSGLIILKVTTTTPSKVAVGMMPAPATPANLTDLTAGTGKQPCQHQLKTALQTTINICLPCHEAYVKGGTRHPLQVRAKPGMVFPAELFVLADGGINCMTCHAAHGSNYQYRLVKSGKAELCRGCHTDK